MRPRTLIVVLALAGLLAGSADLSRPLTHDAYIWQRVWTPTLGTAMSRSRDLVRAWHVLAAETDRGGTLRPMKVDHAALAATERPAVAVFRIDGQLANWNRAVLLDGISSTLSAWRARGTEPAGLEIDYDCATARLADYAAFLHEVRRVSDLPLTVTALPTWLGASALRGVLDAVDDVVLQVHSVQSPEEGLFTKAKAIAWAEQLGRMTQKPFRVALADYGSRVTLGRNGQIFAVESEAPKLIGSGGRELSVDPDEVAQTLRGLERLDGGNLEGVVWFRLPTDGDRRTWSLATWRAVVEGRRAQGTAALELRDSGTDGLFYVTVNNSGERNAALPERLDLPACSAADGANGYEASRTGGGWRFDRGAGGVLRGQSDLVIGWIRCNAPS